MAEKRKVLDNAKWIIVCKVMQALLQFVIGMFCARYLGPSNYGLINYAASIVAFVLPLMQLGLPSTLVQEFTESPENEGKIMGTSLVMNLVSGVACIFVVGGFVAITNASQTEKIIVCILYSVSLLFRAFELFQCWFQFRLLSKLPSVVMLFSYIVVSAYRVFLLVTAKSIFWFAVVNSIDYAIIGFSLLYLFGKKSEHKLSFDIKYVKILFSRSKFYIIAAMMVTIFQNTDHIMLTNMSGDEENGFYTAAVTCATVVQFVYIAIIDSMRPVILAHKKDGNTEGYEKNVSRLYSVIIYTALAQAVGFTVFSKLIISILYGESYMVSVPVLQILVWYMVFACMGSVRNVWILAENKQSMLWKINLVGALLNVVINFFLIPVWGASGAAFATLVTQIFTNFILGFIVKPLHHNNKLLIKGLDPRLILDVFKK